MTHHLDPSKRYRVETRPSGMLALIEDSAAAKPKPKPRDDPGRLRAALDRLRGHTPTASPPTSSPPIRVDLIPPASLAVTASQRAEADWRRTATREQLHAHHEAEQARIAPRPGMCRWCGVATDVHGEAHLCGDCHAAHDPTDPGTSLARRLTDRLSHGLASADNGLASADTDPPRGLADGPPDRPWPDHRPTPDAAVPSPLGEGTVSILPTAQSRGDHGSE